MTKVLITGGTGMIGSKLSRLLVDSGYEVRHLSRKEGKVEGIETFAWDPDKGNIDPRAVLGVDSIIHLAGAGIADQAWTPERKQYIVDSRVKTADLLFEVCDKHDVKLKSFISASAIGYYPLKISRKMYNETAAPGEGFLADVCRQWEQAADVFEVISDRVVKMRIGLVLAKGQGALKQIDLPVRFYAAAGLGTGLQAMSWIHIHDVCRMFKHSLEHELNGVYNAVGPDTVTNQDFMQILADVMEKPLILPNIPEFVIKTLFGQKADLILKGVKLSSAKILDTGFQFDYPTLNSALMNIYSDSFSH